MTRSVFPVVHLTSELKLCGLGTESNPGMSRKVCKFLKFLKN